MGKKAIGIYLRVSSVGQDLGSQEPDLNAWLKVHGRGRKAIWYRDTFTGRTMRRPGIEKLEAEVAAGTVGTVVVWRVDRLGRDRALRARLDKQARSKNPGAGPPDLAQGQPQG